MPHSCACLLHCAQTPLSCPALRLKAAALQCSSPAACPCRLSLLLCCTGPEQHSHTCRRGQTTVRWCRTPARRLTRTLRGAWLPSCTSSWPPPSLLQLRRCVSAQTSSRSHTQLQQAGSSNRGAVSQCCRRSRSLMKAVLCPSACRRHLQLCEAQLWVGFCCNLTLLAACLCAVA